MDRPSITFVWQINLGHVLVAVSTLTAGTAAYVDLRHDVSEHRNHHGVEMRHVWMPPVMQGGF